jgi:uncharacterized protein (TIGR03437 family)
MRSALLALVPAILSAQSLNGPYHFAQLSSRGTTATSLSGTLNFAAAGTFRYTIQIGTNTEPAAAREGEGQWQWSAASNAFTLTNLADNDSPLEVRAASGNAILLGASPSPALHDVFLAVPAPTQPVALEGEFAAAYFRIGDQLTTAFYDFAADGRGRFPIARAIGHAAFVDDVNRREETTAATYVLDANGAGSATFPAASDFLQGTLRLFVSARGDIAIGASPSRRDLFLALRRESDVNTASLTGLFSIAELSAESDFVYRPEAARISAAAGSVRVNGEGSAYVYERVEQAGRVTALSTVNSYRIWQAGDFLAPQLRSGLHNFSYGANAQALVSAQVGMDGELTLEHGLFFAIRLPPPAQSSSVFLSPIGVVNAAALYAPGAAIAPGAAYSLFGINLAPVAQAAPAGTLPVSLAGVRVLINGEPVALYSVSPGQINILAPSLPSSSTATVQVFNNSASSNTVEIPAATAAPAIYTVSQTGAGSAIVTHADFSLITPASPARPGETVVIFAAGLGPVALDPSTGLSSATDSELRVLFNSQPGDISFAGLVPGFSGLFQINVTVPTTTSSTVPVSLAVLTSGAVSDLAEITVR